MSERAPLHTERLTLRRLSEADVPALVAGLDDFAVSRWLTVVPYPYTAEDARGFVAGLEAGPPLEGFGIHAADALVGVVGIGATLGYWLARPAWGKGYATEAAGALVDRYFATQPSDRLGSGYFTGNAASRNVLSKLGFVADGEERVKSRAQDIEIRLNRVLLTRGSWEARHR